MSTEVETKAGFVKFEEYHQPTLADGDYQIKVTQVLEIDKHAGIGEFTVTRNFTVAGDRFELKPADVESVFPPDGNLGEHSNVLPHVILSRSTLPWERTVNGEQGQTTRVPWLALLLFDEDEKPKPKTMIVGDLLREAEAGSPRYPKIKLESGQQASDVLTVIDVPKSLLQKIMPSAEELTLLTHVRFGTDADDKLAGDELAIIIANRLPQRGKTSTAHLVSVEKRFKKVEGAAQNYEFDYQDAKDADLIRLVSLKSWSFACETHDRSFKQLLLGLNGTPSTLRLPEGTGTAQKLFSKGYVVVPHYFREGDQTVSWFRGPLIPGQNTSPRMELPAHSADELVRYDPELSMFDVSYGAAWELGRLLALQDKDFSTGLYQWKREHAQHVAQNEQRLAYSHLPFQNERRVFVPEAISAWFKSLRRLEGVPFNYLVPDERMLAPESIRFFRVDQAWVDCLADGAFSIGRVASSDHEADKSHGAKSPAAGLAPMLTGFLLRSEVVSGWPGLLVDGFSDQGADHALLILRMERLSAGVLLCIFAGEVARVEIYQKPETLHFGLSANGASGLSKKLRDSKGKILENTQVDLNTGHWRPDSPRAMNIAAFAQSITTKLSLTSPLTAAQFGLQMIESGEKIIFLAHEP